MDAVVGNRRARDSEVGVGYKADEIERSELSAQLRGLSAESAEWAAHLERLSAEVAADRYRVDAQELSRRLIDRAWALPPATDFPHRN